MVFERGVSGKPKQVTTEETTPVIIIPPQTSSRQLTPQQQHQLEQQQQQTENKVIDIRTTEEKQPVQQPEKKPITTGGSVPINVKEPSHDTSVQPTPVPERLPPGKVRDLVTGRIIDKPSWTEEERAYYKFSSGGPVQKAGIVFGAAMKNPVDFFGETPKFIYSAVSGDREKAQIGYFNNFLGKEIRAAQNVKTPWDVGMFMMESPFVSIPAFSGAMYGLGYAKGIGGAAKVAATGIERAMGLYFGSEVVKGGVQAYEQGNLPGYAYKTGLYAVGIAAMGGAFSKEGEISGFAKYKMGRMKDAYGLAKERFYMERLAEAKQLNSSYPSTFDVKAVLGESQGVRFQNAMVELKGQRIKPGLAGSSALSTYVKDMNIIPKDIDIHIPMVLRVRSPIGEGMKIQSPVTRVSNVPKVESVFKSHGIDMSKLDIHDMMQPGTEFNTRGIGTTDAFVKTAKGSVFERQMSFSELATRNIKEMMVPEHTLRGKDFIRVADVAAQEFDTTMEMKPSSYAKMLEKKGLVDLFHLKIGKPSPRLEYIVEEPDALGVMIHSRDKNVLIKPELGIKRFLLPNERQVTYAHELIHLEPYLQTGVAGSEAEAYGLEATKSFYKPMTSVELWKYQPELKPGTYEMIGPSYYDTHPLEAPKAKFTPLERLIRKYGAPLTTKDLYKTPPDFTKPTVQAAEQFRPQLLKGPAPIPAWAKGVKFFSSLAALSVKPMRYDYLFTSLGAGAIKTTYPSYKEDTVKYPSRYTTLTMKYTVTPTKNTYPEYYNPDDYIPPAPKTPYIRENPPSYPKYPPVPPGTPKSYPPYKPEYDITTSPPPVPPTQKILNTSDMFLKRKNREEKPGYDVYIKDRTYVHGKKRYAERWKKANTTPLSENAALSLGGTAVDQSAAASFKIRPTSSKAGRLKIGVDPWGMLSQKFYRNKKGTYIESTGNRIDSPGEIRGISALGWIANQNKMTRSLTPARIHYKAPGRMRTVNAVYSVDVDKITRGMGF
jgi:hypothetical protein